MSFLFSPSRLGLVPILLFVLAPFGRADEAQLNSDLSVHGPTIDTRPLENGAGKAAAAPDAPISAQTADAFSSGSLPQDTSVASNETPDISVPGANAVAALPPAADPSTDVAANNIAPLTGAAPKVSEAPPPAPTTNATVNLINLMVKRNLISRDDADGLIREAQQEADNARAQAATVQATAERALTVQQSAPAPAAVTAQANGSESDDEMRISYVPDVVKKQIADQVTQNVMQETREEHLADTIAANQVPEWVKRLHLTGDIRVRFEDDMFPSGNAVGSFINFNAINTGSPINIAGTPQIPQFNANQERERFRLRLRIGAGIDLGDNFTAGVRVATGSDDNPVTENQTLGGASGQGGYFAKYQVWLDRAFLRYEYGGTPDEDASLTVGRFDNPFFNTSMMWSNDLAFDGIVAKGNYTVTQGVTPFLTMGAFPVFNTDFNFSTNNSDKFNSEDKYLFAVQGGTHWTISKDVHFIGGAGIYDFENIQGKVSDPIELAAQDSAGDITGSTDDSRPSFAQNGNTYIALRDYVGGPPAGNPAPPTYEQQYFGLASQFRVLAITGQLDYDRFDPFHLSVTGEFIKNLAFDRNGIINSGPHSDPGPQNNLSNANDRNSFDGGDMGYMIHMDAGKVALEELWDWNIRLSYRYVESDATVDAFTDSDFGAPLSGTNLKGFTIGGNLALSKRVWLGLTYMSADNVSGPSFHSDLVQFDINAKF